MLQASMPTMPTITRRARTTLRTRAMDISSGSVSMVALVMVGGVRKRTVGGASELCKNRVKP